MLWLKLKKADFVIMSNLWICLGRIQNNSDLLPLPMLDFDFILIFTLFNRLPQRLGFPACLFLLNLFSFPNSLPPYPSFVSVPFSSSCFTFSFQPFPSLWSWRSVWLVFTATLHGSLLLFVAGSTTGCFYIFWSNNREIRVLDIQSNDVQENICHQSIIFSAERKMC